MSQSGFNKYREEASGLNAGFQFLDELDKLMSEAIIAGGSGDVRAWWRCIDQLNILTSAFVDEKEYVAIKQELDDIATMLWQPRMQSPTTSRGLATWRSQVESDCYMKLRTTQVRYYQSARKLLMPMMRSQTKGDFFKKMGIGSSGSSTSEAIDGA